MKETLERRTEGFINCLFLPRDFLTHPSRYSTEEETYKRLNSILRRTASHFPREYKKGFKLKCQYKDFEIVEDPHVKVEGQAFYMNADKFNEENPHLIWVLTEILDKVGIYESEQIPRRLLSSYYNFHAGAFFLGFNFKDKESASLLLQAFEKESLIRRNDHTKEPHIRIQDGTQRMTKCEGINAIRFIFGKGKRGDMLAGRRIKEKKFAFHASYSA